MEFMSSVTIVKRAADSFKLGDYETALSLYKQASSLYQSRSFDLNIKLCVERMKSIEQNEVSQNHINSYFDHVYVVNLKNQVAKRLKITNQLRKANISFEVFEATNGYEGEPLERYNDYVSKPLGCLKRYYEFSEREIKRGSKFIESAGAVGYIYTYLNILTDAKKNSYKKFLILEDDIILRNDFESNFINFITMIGDDWKVLQLGASQYGWGSVDTNHASLAGFYHPRRLDTCGSFAIAFDCSVIDEVIEAQQAFEAPFDHLPLGEIYEKHFGKCFVAYPNIVMPDVGDSSIRGGRCQYTHGSRVKWNVENYNYPYPRPSVAVILSSAENLKYFSNFSNHAEMAVELRLFYLSSDGLRPLHNKEMINADYKLDLSLLSQFTLPSVDFCLTIDETEVLTEADISSCVEYLLKLKPVNTTPLREIDIARTGYAAQRVSVVIPTYKRPKNLKNALVSVLEQDYSDVEILVVSDNGADSPFNVETRALVQELIHSYPERNLKLIEHTKNRNGAAARNTAIMQSTGEYICFLDDDDIYLPGRISNSVEVLNQSKGIEGAAYCGFLGWNSPVNDLNRYKTGNLTLEILLLDYKKHYLHTNTATYKRDAVLAINGFDESYRRHQDLEFNLRFFELYNIAVVKEIGVRLNPEPSDISNKVFNISMLNLKDKFLTQFENVINNYKDYEEQIYRTHWNEVVRYISEPEDFLNSTAKYYKNGFVQVISGLRKDTILQ